MNRPNSRWARLLLLTFFAVSSLPCDAQEVKSKESGAGKAQKKQDLPVTVRPVSRKAAWWQKRHQAKLKALISRKDVNLLFIGDSITHGFEGKGKGVWEKYYKPRNAFNIGYSGDRTEHVLWRLDHGEFEGIHPKVAVIMIGTNNTGHRMDSPKNIALGVETILKKIRQKSPKTKVLLLAIFPRGATVGQKHRVNNSKTNELLRKFHNEKMGVHFLDINKKFLAKDGTLPKEIMPDRLHPNKKGYEIWAEALEPKLKELLGENEKK